MNAKPHTHEVQIGRLNDGKGTWVIHYGDTTRYMWNWVPFRNKQKALRKKVKKTIWAHDVGTVKAGERHDIKASMLNEFNSVLTEPNPNFPSCSLDMLRGKDGWGSELLNK